VSPENSRDFAIEKIELGGSAVLKCRGELDFSNEAALMEALHDLLDRRLTYVCLDLRDLDFADTTVVRVVEAIENSVRRRDIRLTMLFGPAVEHVMDVLGWSPELHGVARARYPGSRGRARPVRRGRPGHPRHHSSRTGERRV
jgi:anti-anti-sigma factor